MRTSKKAIFAAVFALGIAFAALPGAETALAAKEITWTGCGITKKAFMAEIADAYKAKTGITISLSGGGATKGIRTVSAGTSDMGGTCRNVLLSDSGKPIPEEENSVLTQVAWDAIVAIANADNPVENLSMDQLKGIFDGQIKNWSQLGGPNSKIVLVTRDGKISGVGHMFRLMAFKDGDHNFKARSFRVKSSGPLEKKVEETVTAFGIDGVSSARKSNVKILSIDGVAPTKENIASGTYPLFRPLYIATNRNASPDVKAVLDYMLSPEGQKVISDEGTVNLEEGKGLVSPWKNRMSSLGY